MAPETPVPVGAIAGGVGIALVCAACYLGFISLQFVFTLAFVGLAGFLLYLAVMRTVHFLNQGDQLVVRGFTGTTVHNGPGGVFLNPLGFRTSFQRKAVTLAATECCKVKNSLDGKERMERGPMLLFLGPYDHAEEARAATSLGNTDYVKVEDRMTGKRTIVKGPLMWVPAPNEEMLKKGKAVSLTSTQYVIVQDKLSGTKKTVCGPCVWFPEPYDEDTGAQDAIALQEDQFIRIKNLTTGEKWVKQGKALVFPEPTWRIEGAPQKAYALKAYEYVRLLDGVTGKIVSHRGEQTVFPGPNETSIDGGVQKALDIKSHEYVKILDQAKGTVRVERGQAKGSRLIFLEPYDRVLDGGKKRAIEIDDEHAVLVRDKGNGQLRLVTEKQLFIPSTTETVEEVRNLIRLADHEALIIKNPKGHFQYFYGSDEKRAEGQPRSFFLEPYAETVKVCWSRGRRREKRDLYIERFDCRPQFMAFEFNCRTSDNVELILEGTFFWEVIDLPLMVKSTGDTSGDLCNHARSQFIRHVARVTLKEFMDGHHVIAKKVWEEDGDFYASRGVKIHSLEVSRYQCADERTSEILEEIIQESTNRMNRLSQAESETEVNLFRTQGMIEQEKMKGELLQIQYQHTQNEAITAGSAESKKIAAFIDGLSEIVPKLDDRVSMWQVLKKSETLGVVADGGANVYFTPHEVDLTLEPNQAAAN